MSLQTTVNVFQTPGIPGDFADDSPRRVAAKNLNAAANDTLPAVGRAFTYSAASSDPTQVQLGNTNLFAGILVNSKELIRSNGLEVGLTVPDNSVGSIATMGHIWVKVTAAIQVGYVGLYNTTTGAISGMASGGTAPSGYAAIPNSRFVLVNSDASGLAVIELY